MTADELVAFAEELSRIAASGAGPAALAGHLAKRTGAGVLVEDADWRHVAASGAKSLPSTARTLLLQEPPSREYTSLRNGIEGRTLPILSGETRLGQLTIFGSGDLDALVHIVRLAASAIAVELARESGGQAGRRRAFWDRLANREYIDASTARDDAASRGVSPATHYIAVALECESADERTATADQAALRTTGVEVLRGADAGAGLIERGNTLVFFVPAEREIDAANARTAASLLPRTLAKKHPQLHAGGGVGTRVPLIEMRQSLEEAQAALTIVRRLYGVGRVGVFEDLGAYPLLLGGADAQSLRLFALRTLEPLRTYDEKHQTELERTLRLYFSAGENVKTAAAQLNVHRHTVFYRLRQIGEICGCKLDDPHDQLTLRMAIAIDALTTS